ncbi:hypothetical protein KKC52_03345 [bacterium]|nr:hypothetical protein [bacterium]
MLTVHKNYVLDEDRRPVAVQVPIGEFERIEEIFENYGLAKLMDEVENEERLSGEAAQQYYHALKSNVEN